MSEYDDRPLPDLLPCPFCGSAPILHEMQIGGHQPVECPNKDCPMSRAWPGVQSWQKRAEPLSRMRTALEEIRALKWLDADTSHNRYAEGMIDALNKCAAIAERALAPEGRALTAGSGNE